MEFIFILACLLAMYVLGILGGYLLFHRKSVGTIRAHFDDKFEEPYLLIELDKPVVEVIAKDRVVFKVDVSPISHK